MNPLAESIGAETKGRKKNGARKTVVKIEKNESL